MINSEFEEIRDAIYDLEIERDKIRSLIQSLRSRREEIKAELQASEEAQIVIQEEAKSTQSEIEEHISGIVTLALSAVEVDDKRVPKPPEFIARAVVRRKSTEIDLIFKEGDREQRPLYCSGFGFIDVADVALRIAFIELEIEYVDDKIRKTLILDEPFRNVDPLLQYKVSDMLSAISKELGYQFIIVSHAEGVNTGADREFQVQKIGKESRVTVSS